MRVNASQSANRVVVVGTDDRALQLGATLDLKVVATLPADVAAIVSSPGARLQLVGFVEGGPMALDLRGAAKARAAKRSDLARAIGVGKGVRTVLDVTAGLGRDAAALWALGLDVTAVERSKILGALWKEALTLDATTFAPVAPPLERGSLTFCPGEALEILGEVVRGIRAAPDVVYLDPMFPPRTKSALVGKDLRTLSRVLKAEQLFGAPETDAVTVLERARAVAQKRVVVKRPRRAPALAPGFAHQFEGTTVRFDLYLSSSAVSAD